jgi:GNAT superfamily N-acetyltransferase
LFFEFELQKYFDSCYTTDDMSGLIVCKKPTEKLRKNNPIAALKLLFSIGFISAFRAIRYLTVSNRMKRKYMTGDMDYICLICVNETSRGKGIAVKMIEEVCGEKAYLETQNEENIRFYEKLGFCLRETVCISNTSNMLKHYVFIRE